MQETIRRSGCQGNRPWQLRLAVSFPYFLTPGAGRLLGQWIAVGLLSILIRNGAAADTVVGEAGLFANAGVSHQQGAFTGDILLNEFLGADRFYNAGYTGGQAVMANIEEGYAWSGHESLAHVQSIPLGSANVLGEVDRHATWVAGVMGGRYSTTNPGDHQMGLAPDAQLYSGAIATNWSGERYTTRFFLNYSNSTFGPYRDAFQQGLDEQRTADVINSSWNVTGGGSDTGTNVLAGVLDALAWSNPQTLNTVSAGNSPRDGEGPNKVLASATAYNNMAVAALGTATTGYDSPSFFSNGGPNNYSDPVNGTVTSARQAIDIAAPGEDIATAYYGGQTGGNRPQLGGSPDGPEGGPDWYTRSVRGTSFAAPIVAGGAALLYDAAYSVFGDNDHSRDARVIKAVLMNSADKTEGWDNGQSTHPNGNGGILTTQGLDDRVGAGRLNLDRAFDQYLSGTTDVFGKHQGDLGSVESLGWDFGLVGEELTNDYLIGDDLLVGSEFTATLTWFRDRQQVGTSSFSDRSYDNLDLELWAVDSGLPLALTSESSSLYNNSEHFSFTIPASGQYMLRVRWTDEVFDMGADTNAELYGLAWSTAAVPEPGTLVLVLALLCPGVLARRRGNR